MVMTTAQHEDALKFAQKLFDFQSGELDWKELCRAFCFFNLNEEQIEAAVNHPCLSKRTGLKEIPKNRVELTQLWTCDAVIKELREFQQKEKQLLSRILDELKKPGVTLEQIRPLLQKVDHQIPLVLALEISSRPLLDQMIFCGNNDIAEYFFDKILEQPTETQSKILFAHGHGILINAINCRTFGFALKILQKFPSLDITLCQPLLGSTNLAEPHKSDIALRAFLVSTNTFLKSQPDKKDLPIISTLFSELIKSMDDLPNSKEIVDLWPYFFLELKHSQKNISNFDVVFQKKPDFALLILDKIKKNADLNPDFMKHYLQFWKNLVPKVWQGIFSETNQTLSRYPDLVEWIYSWLPKETASTIQRPNNDPEIAIHSIRLLEENHDANTIDRVKQILDWLSKKSSDDSATPAINYALATFFLKWLEKNPTNTADFEKNYSELVSSIDLFESTKRNPSQRLCHLHEVYSKTIEIHSLFEDALKIFAWKNNQEEALFGLILINKNDDLKRNSYIEIISNKIASTRSSFFSSKKPSQSPLEWLKSPPKNDRFISDFSLQYTSKIEELLSDPNATEVKLSGPGNIQGL